MRFLFIGDYMGSTGRKTTAALQPRLRKEHGPFDFVVANCENAAAGKGITRKVAEELFAMGIDGLTGGNHIWDKKEGVTLLAEETRIVRPANFPDECPGRGLMILEKNGARLAVASLQGRVYMPPNDCPFKKADALVEEAGEVPLFVDFHAEATSEKKALAHYLDGRAAAVAGTHTHVQTADEQILPGGTAYITDAGMTGGHRSSIGMKLECVIPKFLTGMPAKFEVSGEGPALNGIVVTLDRERGLAEEIVRIFARPDD
ncbi:MAG: TIGR00282 family metallophosphoesterase [Synergistaceae bacterium]|nr:TIGR00282 family metallophosphoesterase [Synergistaceae bacterium]